MKQAAVMIYCLLNFTPLFAEIEISHPSCLLAVDDEILNKKYEDISDIYKYFQEKGYFIIVRANDGHSGLSLVQSKKWVEIYSIESSKKEKPNSKHQFLQKIDSILDMPKCLATDPVISISNDVLFHKTCHFGFEVNIFETKNRKIEAFQKLQNKGYSIYYGDYAYDESSLYIKDGLYSTVDCGDKQQKRICSVLIMNITKNFVDEIPTCKRTIEPTVKIYNKKSTIN